MPQPQVREIHWFVTAYVAPEDRLRFSCTLKTGETDVFWMTQRMAGTLVRKLLEWLDRTVEEHESAEAAHRMAQRSATATRPPKPAGADRIPEGQGWLLNAVNIRTAGKNIVLVFRDEDGRALGVNFGAEHLRRWLKVLYGQYRRSGWPMDMWPDWVAAADSIKAGVESGMVH